MFPIRDHNPSERTPVVTWGLILANIAIFLSYYPQLSGSLPELMGFYDMWALVPAEFGAGEDRHTALTSMFLHGGWMHLIGNMLFLYIFGDNLEDLLGHAGFLGFYLACGFAAAGGQILAGPGSEIPMVGASGAIAGVMGGYLLFFPRARIDVLVIIVVIFKIFPIPAWLMLGIWFGLQVVNGLAVQGVAGGGVAYWAHAGGFVAGVLFVLPLWLRRGGVGLWRRNHGKPPHEEVLYVRDRSRSSTIPRVRRVRVPHGTTSAASDLNRIPKAGTRTKAPAPWSGGRH